MSQLLEFIKALTPLAWPLLLGVLLRKLFPTLKEIFASRAFSVKIGDTQISVQDLNVPVPVEIGAAGAIG